MNTLQLFTKTATGTCFLVEKNSKQYVVTAKHLCKVKSDSLIEISLDLNNSMAHFKGKLFFHDNPAVDIAIIDIGGNLSNVRTLKIGFPGGASIGQECIFLGFPLYGLFTKMETGKVPLAKKAIISAFYNLNDTVIVLLDGHNNPGFSGGPIISCDQSTGEQFIIGIVSGYFYQDDEGTVKINDEEHKFQVRNNSGIIVAYSSDSIAEILNSI